MFVLAEPLCMILYQSQEAAEYLRWFAWLSPMLYCDAVVDALNKGLGKQQICVRINIFTSIMDVVGLYILLPTMGMRGYFISFFLSHAVNAAMSLGLLLKITDLHIPVRVPIMTVAAMLGAVFATGFLGEPLIKATVYLLLIFAGLYLSGILYGEDLRWLGTLVGIGKKKEKI